MYGRVFGRPLAVLRVITKSLAAPSFMLFRTRYGTGAVGVLTGTLALGQLKLASFIASTQEDFTESVQIQSIEDVWSSSSEAWAQITTLFPGELNALLIWFYLTIVILLITALRTIAIPVEFRPNQMDRGRSWILVWLSGRTESKYKESRRSFITRSRRALKKSKLSDSNLRMIVEPGTMITAGLIVKLFAPVVGIFMMCSGACFLVEEYIHFRYNEDVRDHEPRKILHGAY